MAAVETAIAVTLFILLFVLVVDFALVVNCRATLGNAANLGARYAALHTGESDAQVRSVVRSASPGIMLPDTSILVSPSAPRMSGDTVTVTVTSSVGVDPLVARFAPNPYPVTAAAIRRSE
jgi:Flp pilus assembly protein TadG